MQTHQPQNSHITWAVKNIISHAEILQKYRNKLHRASL